MFVAKAIPPFYLIRTTLGLISNLLLAKTTVMAKTNFKLSANCVSSAISPDGRSQLGARSAA